MKNIISIDLRLENCEIIALLQSEIGKVSIQGIHTEYSGSGLSGIEETLHCEELEIELLPQANRSENLHQSSGMEKLPFARLLKYPDIASCELFFDDGTSDLIWTPWEGNVDDDDSNRLQSSYLSKNGALYIYIGRDGDVRRHVLAEVDDPRYAACYSRSWE